MNKFTFIFLTGTLMCFIFQQALAQNSSPYWSLAGNSNASTSSKLGTTTSTPLYLVTNKTARLYISPSAGYVGIGTTAPTTRLQVNTAAGTAPLKLQIDNNTKLYVSKGGGLTVGSGTSAPANGLYVVGDVGIGTATPEQKLDVEGSAYISGNLHLGHSTLVKKLSISYTGTYTEDTTAGGDAIIVRAYGAGAAWGVNAYSTNSIGIYGSTGNTTSYAGYFAGNVFTTGSYLPSDGSLKNDIEDVSHAMGIIGKLKPKSYTYKQDGNYRFMNLPQGKRYGLIAQDVEQVLPDLVKPTTFDPDRAQAVDAGSERQPSEAINFKAVNYTELIPIMIKGMQEQQRKIDDLLAQVNKLLQEKGTNTPTRTGVLSQNAPNPAKTATRIAYTLPANTGRAQLLLTDNLGKTIRLVSLNASGIIDINTAALSSGVYNYSLMIDGKIVETKKMEVIR